MVAHVISHRGTRRKRANADGWLARRFGALVVTVTALGVASWLAPRLQPAATLPTVSAPTTPAIVLAIKGGDLIKPDTKAPPVADVASAPRQHPPVSLNVPHEHPGEGYEILSATELAAISQAHERERR